MSSHDHYPPIGFIQTCFTEKFGTPRQSLMVSDARAILKLNPDPSYLTALNHLDEFSHVWIVFAFHQHLEKAWRPTIRPPRLEAPRRVGVFASRSPHRPNPIGLSAVKLDRINREAPGGIEIHLSGVDIMDGSPVLDIKPYLPFADCIPEAHGGWAHEKIKQYPVKYSPEALDTIHSDSGSTHPQLQSLVTQMLEWDPRPTSQRRALPIETLENEGKTFAFRIFDFDVHWEIRNQGIYVREIRTAPKS